MNYVTKALGGLFLDVIKTVVIALSIFLIVYLFLMQPHQVNGQSMVPNFHDKDYLLTDKVTYKRRDPQRGEVVVFHAPDQAGCPKGAGCDFIKRVLGVPGESVEIKDGGVYINGVRLQENYLPADFVTQAGAFTKNRQITLGENEFFVAGDNRDHSSDSRAWGPVTKDKIIGRVFFRYWPLDQAGIVEHARY